MTIRVVIADDQGMVRSGFTVLLNAQDDIEVIGEAALVIEVRNDASTSGSPAARDEPDKAGRDYGSGQGIIGMRERATMLGGHLEARPAPNGEFLVTAALPLGSGQEGAP